MPLEPNAASGFSTGENVDPTLRATEWRTATAIALVFFLFYAGFNHARFKSTDETGVFYLTESLYERHTLAVPVHLHAHIGHDGRLYSPFAVGQSVLALPLYAMAKGARAILPEAWVSALEGRVLESRLRLPPFAGSRVSGAMPNSGPPIQHTIFGGTLEVSFVGLYAPILSALLAMSLFVLLRRLDVSPRSALLTTFLISVCSYPAMQSVYFLRHTSEIVCVVFAFALIREFIETGRAGVLAAGCAFASFTFLVRFPGVLAGPAIGLYLAHAVWDRHRDCSRAWLPDLLAVFLPLIVGIGIHIGFNYARWGTLIDSPMVAGGFETSDSFTTALTAFLFSPGIGLFAYSPLLLLLPWALPAAWQRWPWECASIGLYAVTQLLYFSNYAYWTGLWSAPGPRYLLPSTVLMLVALGAWIDRGLGRWSRLSLAGLAIVGGVVQFMLLTANWWSVISGSAYRSYDPQFSFLFIPSVSPIIASGRAITYGYIDNGLWKLAVGWPGQEASPAIAVALAILWLGGSGLGAWLLWRHVGRSYSSLTNRSDSQPIEC